LLGAGDVGFSGRGCRFVGAAVGSPDGATVGPEVGSGAGDGRGLGMLNPPGVDDGLQAGLTAVLPLVVSSPAAADTDPAVTPSAADAAPVTSGWPTVCPGTVANVTCLRARVPLG